MNFSPHLTAKIVEGKKSGGGKGPGESPRGMPGDRVGL